MSTLDVIVGGQFGSEAKGHATKQVIKRMVQEDHTDLCRIINIRVAGPNAGHCVYDEKGQKFAMRTVPVGFVFKNVLLMLGPGSEIEPEVLWSEIEEAEAAGHIVCDRLTISAEATLLTDEHKQIEAELAMHDRIGSTAKGIGAARANRIMRRAERVADNMEFQEMCARRGITIHTEFTPTEFDHIVIEGTQGYGLGLHAGYYPQCTSSDTRAVDFIAMAGLDPWFANSVAVWVVARVYPIRVAGNSGPLKGESTWEELGLPEEYTTVTKKVRRVGEWDPDLVAKALDANGRNVSNLVLTMLDQKFGEVQGHDNTDLADGLDTTLPESWSEDVQVFLSRTALSVGARDIAFVCTGEDTAVWLR